MQPWWAAAATASILVLGVHVIGGGREIARPLLDAPGLAKVPKFVSYYCWHLATISIALMGFCFASSAVTGSAELARLATVQSVLFTALSIAIIVGQRLSPWLYPQWAFFLVVAGIGLMGFR